MFSSQQKKFTEHTKKQDRMAHSQGKKKKKNMDRTLPRGSLKIGIIHQRY